MNWDSYIENEGELRFVTLPEGDYDFEVTKFEKSNYEGSPKVKPCPMALLELTFTAPEVGKSVVKERLFLDESVEWKLCEFFRSIGQKQHGKGITMDWDKVLGAKGHAHLIVNSWEGQDGEEKTNNRVKRFLDPVGDDEGPMPW